MTPCVVYLQTQEKERSGKGFVTGQTTHERKVIAGLKSIGCQEFYAAQHAGKRVEKIFRMRLSEYHDESVLRHGDTTYDVIRTYSGGVDYIELSCAKR